MRTLVFDARSYDRIFLDAANAADGGRHELVYTQAQLDLTTVGLARGLMRSVCL
jgi:D-lactate dehydrogenase